MHSAVNKASVIFKVINFFPDSFNARKAAKDLFKPSIIKIGSSSFVLTPKIVKKKNH